MLVHHTPPTAASWFVNQPFQAILEEPLGPGRYCVVNAPLLAICYGPQNTYMLVSGSPFWLGHGRLGIMRVASRRESGI